MKLKTVLLLLLVAGASAVVTWRVATRGNPSAGPANGARKILYYQSAMHPWIKSDKPGRCTICGMELTPVYEGEAGITVGGDVVTLSETSVRVLNVQSTGARLLPIAKTLRVAGTMEDDESRRRVLPAYVGGRIEQLHVANVGAEVRAGEPLAEFYSPMLLTAVRDYLVVLRGAGGDATTNGADSGLVSSAATRLRQMGLSEAQIDSLPQHFTESTSSFPILAPISGTVIGKRVLAGQYVAEGEKLFELADFSTMWFQFRAYELDLPWLKPGLPVVVATPARPGHSVTGAITFIDPNFDAATRSTQVRVELANPLVDGRRLFSNRLYADGVVQLEGPPVLAVPRSAVLQGGTEASVILDEGGGGYARRVVQLGRVGDSVVEILSGLSPGDKVVVQGNLLIDGQAEMNRAFATPASSHADAHAVPSAPGKLVEAQSRAARDFVVVSAGLAEALAADDLAAFNGKLSQASSAKAALVSAFGADSAWHEAIDPVQATAQLEPAPDLIAARQAFHPFSEAGVRLALALARTGEPFSDVKVFRCPMTQDAFPGAPAAAAWIQLQPEVRNPWYGAEMSDCGAEVKP